MGTVSLRDPAGIARMVRHYPLSRAPPDRAVLAVPNGSLIELLAIRLVLDRFALRT